MRILVLDDGEGAAKALKLLAESLSTSGIHLSFVYVDAQPKATPQQIAAKTIRKLRGLQGRKFDKAVLLVDMEDWVDRGVCPSSRAHEIADAIRKDYDREIDVVLKVRMFENWLLADIDALVAAGMMKKPAKSFRQRIEPNKADEIRNPVDELQGLLESRKYHKTKDAMKIMSKMDPLRAARNSRSFRRFLRVLGVAQYKDQSKRPAKEGT